MAGQQTGAPEERAEGVCQGSAVCCKPCKVPGVSWDHRQDDHMHRLKVSMQRRQGVMTVITRPATNRNRFALTQQQLARLAEEVSWDKACADDTILLQQFVSTQTQTLKRPGHLLDTCRVNVKLTDPEEECLASVFGTLQFSEIGTAGAFHKLKSDADNFGYEIGTFKPSSLDPQKQHPKNMTDVMNSKSMANPLNMFEQSICA